LKYKVMSDEYDELARERRLTGDHVDPNKCVCYEHHEAHVWQGSYSACVSCQWDYEKARQV